MTILHDGYQTLITFALNPAVTFKEISITPPGLDGGDAIDTTTMHNVKWRTMQPKALITMTESSLTVAYDPVFLDEANAMLNLNQLITLTFPDGSTWEFYGFLKNFTPGQHTEGERPTADCTVVCTNEDNSHVETDPVYTA